MSYNAYIIFSHTHHYYYRGATNDPMRCCLEHNEGRNASIQKMTDEKANRIQENLTHANG
jgi:predicted GIY-YIG superfamily endonuclease